MSRRKTSDELLNSANVVEVYTYYFERLVDLALSQFQWEGLPETIDRRYMERTLLFNGSAAWYYPESPDGSRMDFPLCTSWVQRGGRFTAYGYPMNIMGVEFNGRQVPVSEFYLIYDNMSRAPLVPKMRTYASLLAQAHLTARSNMMRQNTPYIVSTSKQEKLSVANIFKRIFTFDPVIEVKNTMDLAERIQKIDLDVPFKANEIMEYRKALWNDAVSMLGITTETTKKERMISSEMSMNRQEDNVTLRSRLMNREELCDRLNDRYGYNISVSMPDMQVPDEGTPEDEFTNQEATDG